MGETFTAKDNNVYKPFIRHYDGTSWRAVTIPGAPSFVTAWVSASSAKNVWVGGQGKSSKSSKGVADVVYRWNGARWSKIPLPAQTTLNSVTVLSTDNVWAYADSGTIPYNIFHWTGKKWHYYLGNSTNFIPQGLSASGSTNVWVSGFKWSCNKQLVAAYRWNGTAWHSVTMPHAVNYGEPTVTAVSASNVWISDDSLSSQHALHWDGHRWTTMNVPSYGNSSDIVPDGKGGYWFGSGATLTGNVWVSRPEPEFTDGDTAGVIRIPGTTSFLLNAGAAVGDDPVVRPTIFGFDL